MEKKEEEEVSTDSRKKSRKQQQKQQTAGERMVFMFNNSEGHKERVKIIIKEITKRIINVVILVFRWSREIEREILLKFNTAAPLLVK